MAIVGLTVFKEYMNVSDVSGLDDVLQVCLDSSEAYIKSYCNRSLVSDRYVERVTCYNPFWITVSEFPLTAVHGITCFSDVTDATGVARDLDEIKFFKDGRIYDSYGNYCTAFPQSVLVEYTAGYTESDKEWNTLQWLTLEIGGQIFRNRGIANVASIDTGGVIIKKFETAGSILSFLGMDVLVVLNMFARRGPRDFI